MTNEQIDNLSHQAKWEIYMFYLLKQISPKVLFSSAQYDFSKIEIKTPKVEIFKPEWNAYSFADFCSPERIKTTDIGEVWQKRGYASRLITNIEGIYKWFFLYQETVSKTA